MQRSTKVKPGYLKAETSMIAGAVFAMLIVPSIVHAQATPTVPPANADAASEDTPQDDGEPLLQIIVTGSSIRGVPPVGSNLVEVDRDAIEATGGKTIQDVLASVPQLQTFNTAPRPEPKAGQGPQSAGPSLRGLGPQQTLALINGHRLVPIGTLQNLADPAVVPPAALSRIEVVADGASSVYGSDAIAGVVNVITRRDLDGGEISASYGEGGRFSTANVDAVLGKRWGRGFVLGAASYTWSDNILGQELDFRNIDRTSVGGQDNRSRNCADPNLRVGSTDYAYPILQPNTLNRCDNGQFSDVYPEQSRANFFLSGRHAISNGIEIFGDANLSISTSDYLFGPSSPGPFTINDTNPFFRPIPGVSATSYRVTTNLQAITGRVFQPQHQRARAYNVYLGADIALPREFNLTLTALGGDSYIRWAAAQSDSAAVNAAAAGTTPATALDPFGGRTSAAVIAAIYDSEYVQDGSQALYEGQAKIDGALLALPAGEVKLAFGVVGRKEKFDGLNSIGAIGAAVPASLGLAGGDRTIYSVFGELFIPLFGFDNGRPGLRQLDVSLSGRYDDYSDFGGTFNPKVGVNWSPVDGLTLRGSYGTSFHAPQLADLFGPDSRATYNPSLTGNQAPPDATGPIASIGLAGSNTFLEPETAKTISFGFDLAPVAVPRLRLSGTYYRVDFRNQVGFPVFSLIQTDPGYQQYVYRNPSTELVRQIISGYRTINFTIDNIPPVAQLLDLRRRNFGQILTEGIDFQASYLINTSFGTINTSVVGTRTLSFKTKTTPIAPQFEQIETGGIPTVPWGVRGTVDLRNSRDDRLTIAANWSSSYKNAYVSTVGVNSIETVDSFLTVDVRASIKMGTEGFLDGTNLELRLDNAFDHDPPETREGNGFGRGNLLGRVFTVGVRQKF